MAGVISIGFELRRARCAQGLRLAVPAQELCICQTYLEAMEADKFSALPSFPYAVGYLRNYATFLGLSPDPLVEQLKRQNAPAPVETPSVPNIRHNVKRRKSPILPIISFAGSLALIVFALYFGWDAVRGGPDRASMVPELPAHLVALLASEPEQVMEAPAALLADGGQAYFDALLPDDAETVRVLAVSDALVLVIDAEGAVIREGIFYAGESIELAKQAGFSLATADAGALVFFISNSPSSVTAMKAGDLFQISLDTLQPGIDEPIPAS